MYACLCFVLSLECDFSFRKATLILLLERRHDSDFNYFIYGTIFRAFFLVLVTFVSSFRLTLKQKHLIFNPHSLRNRICYFFFNFRRC